MKIYKLTLWISIIIFSILFTLSSVLYFWNDFEIISFIIDWCVGVACSILVVIITTLIQFKVEQKRIIKHFGSNVRNLLFLNDLRGDIFTEPIEELEENEKFIQSQEQRWFEGIDENIKKIANNCLEIEFFFKSKKMITLHKRCLQIRLNLVKEKNKKELYKQLQDELLIFAQSTLEFGISEYDKTEIEKYIKELQEKQGRT